MPFNTLIQRTDAAALVPEQVSNQMLNTLPDSSAALGLGQRIPVARNQVRFPILSALPQAYWVSGDTGLKQTTTQAWTNKFLNIEELATIVPIPESVLEDAGFDVFGAVRPHLEAAIGRAFDQAVFFGTNKPASFPNAIITDAATAGNQVTIGTSTVAQGGLAGDISNLVATLEADGYFPTAGIARTTVRGSVRSIRSTAGEAQGGDVTPDNWYGADITYPMRGLWPTAAGSAQAIIGDFSQMVVGVRRDFTYKVLTEGVITDAGGLVQFNLPQQDMIAIRLTFRAGWQLANPLNYDEPVAANRYPFARLNLP